jgi:hypothetical protein
MLSGVGQWNDQIECTLWLLKLSRPFKILRTHLMLGVERVFTSESSILGKCVCLIDPETVQQEHI